MTQPTDTKKLIAIGAVVAIIIAAAIGIFAGGSKDEAPAADTAAASADASSVEPAAANPGDDPIVAKVDGADVKRSAVVTYIQTLPPQLKQVPLASLFPLALDQVVNQQIVENKASKADLESDPEVTKRLAEAKQQIIRAVYLEKEIEKKLSESRLKDAYSKFKDEQGKIEEIRASHILVDTKEKADELIQKLDSGAKFEDLAKENSKDNSKANGGDLGYFTQKDMVPEFANAAFKLNKGESTNTPVKTQFGWHIIKLTDKRTRPVPSYEEVKPALAANERRELLNEIIKNWRDSADVETFDINGKPVAKSDQKKEETKSN